MASRFGEHAERLEEVARGADGTRHDDRPASFVGHRARVLCREPVDLAHAVLHSVQHQPASVTAEAVGQDDVGPCIDETLVQGTHAIRMLQVPHLRRVARREAHGEQVGAGGAIGEQGLSRSEQRGEHGNPVLA